MEQNNTNPAPTNKRFRVIGALFAAIGFFGFLDATYLAAEYLSGNVPPCAILKGCDTVTRSAYATLHGVPISVLGSLYYLTVIVLALIALDKHNVRTLRLVSWLSFVGFLFSVYLFLVQALALHAFCIYCIGSATTSTLLFIVGMYALIKIKAETNTN